MSTKCFVYFISDSAGNCKIGISMNVKSRLATLQTGHASQLYVSGYIKTDNRQEALKVEKELHTRYRASKIRGEWFNITPEEVTGYNIEGLHSKSEEYSTYSINRLPTRIGDIFIDKCAKELNKAEYALLQFMFKAIQDNVRYKEKNTHIVSPTRCEEWTEYLQIALKKNYPHMNCLGIVQRVKRGTYMLNPSLFIPAKDMEWYKKEWDNIREECKK